MIAKITWEVFDCQRECVHVVTGVLGEIQERPSGTAEGVADLDAEIFLRLVVEVRICVMKLTDVEEVNVMNI